MADWKSAHFHILTCRLWYQNIFLFFIHSVYILSFPQVISGQVTTCNLTIKNHLNTDKTHIHQTTRLRTLSQSNERKKQLGSLGDDWSRVTAEEAQIENRSSGRTSSCRLSNCKRSCNDPIKDIHGITSVESKFLPISKYLISVLF